MSTPISRVLKVLALGTMAGLSMGSSCLNPCERLADKICSCEPTEAERNACKRQAKLQQDQRRPTNDELIACGQLLSTCECRALTEGRLEACGLSRE